jgi:hypothetical protein
MLKGAAAIAVTETPARKDLPNQAGVSLTLRNKGSYSAYYRFDDTQATATFLGATDTAIRALNGSELAAGVAVIIPEDDPWLDMVCLAGETTTCVVDAGEQLLLAPA